MDESRTRVNSGVVSRVVASLLLETTYIDMATKSIHLAEREIVPYNPSPLPILEVHETESKAEVDESDSCQEVTEGSALSEKLTGRDPNYITFARQGVLREMCEKPVLVSTKPALWR